MADNFKSYTQAVADGDIYVWSAGGDKMARKELFDQNTKFVLDNQTELWTRVNAAMITNAGTTGELNAQVAAQILELQKITENAPAALDTLKEIADSLNNDTDFAMTVTQLLALKANKIVDHDLVPDEADTRNLGSPEKPFKDLYLSDASLYVDGQQVISSNAGTIVITADSDQNVRLTTSGGGDIEFYPSGTGNIELKGTVEIASGKLLRTSDGSPLLIDQTIDVDGNIIGENITAIKLNDTNIDAFLQDISNLKLLVASDEGTLDTLQEIVDFISVNRSTLETLGISGVIGLQSALNDLAGDISDEISARGQAILAVNGAISNEATLRYEGDAANLVLINNEVTARDNAVNAVDTRVTNEVTARQAAVTLLQNGIATTQTALGLKLDLSIANDSHIGRADKYLSQQAIANMIYTDNKLTKVRYNNDTDEEYEVPTYDVNGKLTAVEHYVAGTKQGTTTLRYTDDKLTSVTYA